MTINIVALQKAILSQATRSARDNCILKLIERIEQLEEEAENRELNTLAAESYNDFINSEDAQ